MMIKSTNTILLTIMTVLTANLKAQNVPNPDFELKVGCPFTLHGVYYGYVTSWSSPTEGSSDYFNTCGFMPPIVTPYSGTGFVGSLAETSGNRDSKEYVMSMLSAPLVAGVTYTVSYYVAEAFFSNPGMGTFEDLPIAERGYLGLCFSTVAPTTANITEWPNDFGSIRDDFAPTGRVYIPADHPAYTSRNSWVPVTLQYTATGGEQYMTVGQFREGISSAVWSAYFFYDGFSNLSVVQPAATPAVTTGCPANTYNLQSAVTSTTPSGAELRFFNNSEHTGSQLTPAQVAAAAPGTYYAFYYYTASATYSAATAITVADGNCCPAGDVAPVIQ
ncbi:hypothetical protein HNP38_001148 [Chryseobacterium defluvii]|uniref:Uncharacterized protein n=1 Tax=Chryseobacterium defluvii TaxID=160396 RepID=A0A840K9H8_9FLAO|nr:hypothetical protein [Chryseobacterium defluvii]MBB4805876.1 hypothetical protein [Chryseobacterium defluvii]